MNRTAALLALGAAALVVILAVPGPQFEPYRAPPDPTRKVTGSMTPPRLLNYDETLAYLGNDERVYPDAAGTVVLEVRVDELGASRGMRRLSGNGDVVHVAEGVARYHRYSPALDEQGRPVPVWWPVTITLPVPMTLELEGMARGRLPGRPIPAGGYTVADLIEGKPTFTPLTELPGLLNPDEVARAIEAAPPASSDFIWKRLPVFFLIDRDGTVERVRLDGYSGNDPTYQTVLDIAAVHRFSPARADGQAVVSWVRLYIPIRPSPSR